MVFKILLISALPWINLTLTSRESSMCYYLYSVEGWSMTFIFLRWRY